MKKKKGHKADKRIDVENINERKKDTTRHKIIVIHKYFNHWQI